MTTQAQRHKVSEIASEITKLQGIQSAVVDDDNGYGSFNVFIELRNRLEGHYASRRIEFEISLHGLMARITRIIERHGARLEWHEPPRRQYSRQGHGKKLFEGYSTDSYKISVHISQPEAEVQRQRETQLAFA
jgi:hypothetical protein